MAPDDLPIDPPAGDAATRPRTKPGGKPALVSIGPEAEVRGGPEEPEDPPIEQQKREDEARR